ncbi:MAG: alginate export family protein [Gammaproteobacteria bacterium]
MIKGKTRIILLALFFLVGIPQAPAQEPAFDRNGRPQNGLPAGVPTGDAAPEPDIQLTPSLTLGGRYDTKYELERNFNLEDDDDEDEVRLEPELTLSLSYEPQENFEGFLAAELKREYGFDVSEESETGPLRLELTEAYLDFDEVLEIGAGEIGIRAGRQRFDDEREWLYDERLDGVRFFYQLDEPFAEASELTVELSVTRQNSFERQLLTNDGRDKINNYFLYAHYEADEVDIGELYELEDVQFAAYLFKRDQLNEDDEDPLLMGIQSYAEVTEQLLYWLELAHVRGERGANDIHGYAVDLFGNYELEAPMKPSFVLGYAFATGDSDPDDGTDRNFRQTGLQDNQHSLDGNISFRYYGVLMEPELSNLQILTAGAGIKPSENVSVNLLYHQYRQHAAFDELRDTNLDADPTGESRDIGSAIDLVSGIYFGHWALDVEVGYFMPGEAFDDDENDNAFFTELDLKFKF